MRRTSHTKCVGLFLPLASRLPMGHYTSELLHHIQVVKPFKTNTTRSHTRRTTPVQYHDIYLLAEGGRATEQAIKKEQVFFSTHTFLGHLAKIMCNIWYVDHMSTLILIFLWLQSTLILNLIFVGRVHHTVLPPAGSYPRGC